MTSTFDLEIAVAEEIAVCAELLDDDGPSETAYTPEQHAQVVHALDLVHNALRVPGTLALLRERLTS